MTDYQLTLDCIDTLLNVHAAEPFGVLRESGIQAELRDHLLRAFPDRVSANIVQPLSPDRFTWSQPTYTKRVQLEMKVCYPAGGNLRQRADLVVLRNEVPVQLTCHGNGPGDVVAALRPQDVAVAVEIKASPSHTLEQRTKYADDLQRLLVLNENCGIEGFFVLLDKSHPLYGSVTNPRWTATTIDMRDWDMGGANISIEMPDKPAAVVTMCYLCPEGRATHVFVWK